MPRRNRTPGWPDSSAQQRRRNVVSASLHRSDHRDGAIRIVPDVDGIVVLALEGDFDRHDAPTLGEQLDRALEARDNLVLDLSEVTFVDSSIVNELFRAAHVARERGQIAVLQLGNALLVERILEIVGIDTVLPCAHEREEAIQIIQRGASKVLEAAAATG
jgi:anti-anti-sigma factor